MRGSGAQSLWQLPVSYTAHSLCVAVTYTDVRGEGGELLANSATTERALRCLTSDCMPGNCRRMPVVVTILERVIYTEGDGQCKTIDTAHEKSQL